MLKHLLGFGGARPADDAISDGSWCEIDPARVGSASDFSGPASPIASPQRSRRTGSIKSAESAEVAKWVPPALAWYILADGSRMQLTGAQVSLVDRLMADTGDDAPAGDCVTSLMTGNWLVENLTRAELHELLGPMLDNKSDDGDCHQPSAGAATATGAREEDDEGEQAAECDDGHSKTLASYSGHLASQREPMKKFEVVAAAVRCRTLPSLSASVAEILRCGSTVEALEVRDGWVCFDTQSVGFIATGDAKDKGNARLTAEQRRLLPARLWVLIDGTAVHPELGVLLRPL